MLQKRQRRVRNKLKAVANHPLRLTVFRSSKNIYAQIIDDSIGQTQVSYSTVCNDSNYSNKCTIESATHIGSVIAKKAKDLGITKVYFDRGGYPYHGRIKAVAEAVRNSGIEL